MKKYILFSLLFLFEIATAQDHLQNSNWFFGNSGELLFDTSSVSSVTAPEAFGDCASVSDACGNLLFITNGNKVWQFKNGQYILLADNLLVSNTNFDDVVIRQNLIIVPRPNHPKSYYIVTIHISGVYYSEIDLSSGNGVLSNINTPLTTREGDTFWNYDNDAGIFALTSTTSVNGNYWIVGANSNSIFNFLADENGIGGVYHASNNSYRYNSDYFDYNSYYSPVYIKVLNSKMAVTIADSCFYGYFDSSNGSSNLSGQLQLRDFTGLRLDINGVEFSPDAGTLYFSRLDGLYKYQFGSAPEAIDVDYNAYSIDSSHYLCGLQLGINGKIYGCIFNSASLLEISNPNDYYSAAVNIVSLAGGTLGYHRLPQWVPLVNESPPEPTFGEIAPICSGAALSSLPTSSLEGFTGTWSPALDNTQTTDYYFTPDTGQCASATCLTILVDYIKPTFAAVAPTCSGYTLNALPTTSTNGISGTWSPALDNTKTTQYTFTPNPGQCASKTTLTIGVDTIEPLFSDRNGYIYHDYDSMYVGICEPSHLTTTSTNGITGTWSILSDSPSYKYCMFTPNPGQCAKTTYLYLYTQKIDPYFDVKKTRICPGETFAPLPTTSIEGITGTWTPALNNTVTTTYTFTPDDPNCAYSTSLTFYVIIPKTTPTFTPVTPICSGSTLSPLPTISDSNTNNLKYHNYDYHSYLYGISGTWSPPLNNTATTTYTFTPTHTVLYAPGGISQCAVTTTMTITVNPTTTPTFTQADSICSGATLSALPTISDNGITGTWSPALNNTSTTTYTFTPTAGLCATTATMTITVNPLPEQPVLGTPTQPTCTTATGSFAIANYNSSYTYSVTPSAGVSISGNIVTAPVGTYTVTAMSGSCNSIASTGITIDSQPTTLAQPVLGAPTQPTCTVATGSFAISNYNASYSYSVTPSTGVLISGDTVTVPAGTYTLMATLGNCNSIPSALVIINAQPVNIWNGSGWSAGHIPTNQENIVFAGNYSSLSDLSGCSCQVNSGTIVINSGHNLIVTNEVKVLGGSLTFEDAAALVQINEASVNTGNITYKRKTTALKQNDFVYWSSSVSGATLSQLVTNAAFYAFDPNIDNWVGKTGTTAMMPGVGYIARSSTATGLGFTTSFIGKPNNGTITTSIVKGTGNANLIGNPYPSAIDADLFITDAVSSGILKGTIFLWTDSGAVANNSNTSNDYAKYNLTGGTTTFAGGGIPNGKIASGQGFFMESLTNGTVTFKNSMRVLGNNSFSFDAATATSGGTEKHRVWLSLKDGQGVYNQMLVGYVQGATNGMDMLYDGEGMSTGNKVSIYTMISTDKLSIQGRALPFSTADVVAIGYDTTIAGQLTINLDKFDGLFTGNQTIYLRDNLLAIDHDLKQSPYIFTTASGTFTNRFELVFITKTVGVASASPTLCAGTALTAITHTTTGATGIANNGIAGANGLPAGVSATWTANVITISGAPVDSGIFNYSIPLTGGYGTVNATGTITVTANNTVGVASSSPSLCIGTALTAITHTTSGATGIANNGIAGANGLPAGVSATWAANVITISGTPTDSGIFNYNIPLKGSCGNVNATGTITVISAPAQPALAILTHPSCTMDKGSFRITNFNGSYFYTISSPPTGVLISGGTVTAPAGSYTVTAKSGSCTSVPSAAVVINARPAIPSLPIMSITQPSCTSPTGTITVAVENAGDTYSFDNGATFQTGNNKMVSVSGTYYVKAKNTSGCTSGASAAVVAVDHKIIPTFAPVVPIYSDSLLTTAGALPLNSTNDPPIHGHWSPPNLNKITTTTYTFIPDDPNCFENRSLTIEVLHHNSNPGGGGALSQNYIKKTVYKTATDTLIPLSTDDIDKVVREITYFDGLGRPIQHISGKQSGDNKDIVKHIEYDDFGRDAKDYLPIASTQNDLAIMDSEDLKSRVFDYYQQKYQDANPLSEKEFEASPLNRVLKQASPGGDWALGNGHEIKFDYQANDDNEVKFYSASFDFSADTIDLVNGADSVFYPANELYKTITKNENWVAGRDNTTEEFKDKEGHVVLKRTYDNNDPHDTYYVYDQYGNLTYVIPPIVTNASTQLDDLCYQYKYDYRNRLVGKKLPGKQWEFIVYDKLDRVVATGPALSPFTDAAPGTFGWLITKYDAFNRVVYTGWQNAAASAAARASKQSDQNGLTSSLSESKTASGNIDGVAVNYSNLIEPTDFKLLTVNYYDDYDFPNAPVVPATVDGQPVFYNNANKPKGLATGSWVRVPEAEGATPPKAEISYMLYDKKAHLLETWTTNYLGGYTIVDNNIDPFSGKVHYTLTKHKREVNAAEVATKDSFTYTDQDRVLQHTHQINGGTIQLLAENTYDSLGQLISKKVGNSSNAPLQKVDYSYNIRGWMKGINNDPSNKAVLNPDENDLFAFKINYNEVENATNYTGTKLYNGNISETWWRTANDQVLRKYGYEYDNLNRLTNAIYQKPDSTVKVTGSYNESAYYDKNGNITGMQRTGAYDDDIYQFAIDDLTYSYIDNNGNYTNRLMKVTDKTNNPNGFNDDFADENDADNDYGYDANGNMTKDDNKGITSIRYNHLNLPVEINIGADKITYLYTAAGKKVKKVVTDGNVITTTDYLDGYQYLQSNATSVAKLQFFPHAEGYVNNTVTGDTNNYNYVFNYTDHLGNVRLSYGKDPSTGDLKILEENNYYPFGLKHENYNMDKYFYEILTYGDARIRPASGPLPYKYKYNGKELQDELGLNMYDYGARNYDPALGRWMNIDPLAEKSRRCSPYTYAMDNPVYFIDPDGREIVIPTYLRGSERRTIMRNLSKLTDDKLSYDKKTGQVSISKVIDGNKNAGSMLIDNLISDNHTNTIVTGTTVTKARPESTSHGKIDWTNASDGTGDDVLITFSPKADTTTPTLDAKTGNVLDEKAPIQVDLAHDLIHADHINNGDVNLTPEDFTYKNENGDNVTETDRSEEFRTVGLQGVKSDDITENDIREEQKTKQRGAY